MRTPRCSILLALLAAGCSHGEVSQHETTAVASASAPVASAAPTVPVQSSEFLRAFAATRRFRLGAPKNVTLTPDGKIAVFLRSGPRDPKQSLLEENLATGAVREIATPESVLGGAETLSVAEKARRERMRVMARGFASFELSPDGATIVTSLSGRLFAIERASGHARELPTGKGAALDPHLSPDGTKVAYVRDDDVRVVKLAGGGETQVTKGGTELAPHGVAEFAAQEELRRNRGFWWLPSGKTILYEESDSSHVETMTIADPSRPESTPDRFRYPRPGKANAEVHLALISADGGTPLPVSWDTDRFPYLATVTWTENAPPTIVVLDRLEETEDVLAIDEKTGKTRLLVEEKDAAWVNQDPSVPRWLDDGSAFLWSTERAGAWELELRGASGEAKKTLVPASLGYRSLAALDEKNEVALVNAGAEPTEGVVLAAPLDGSTPKVLAQVASGEVTADGKLESGAWVAHEKSLSTMPKVTVRGADGALARELVESVETPASLPRVEMTKVGADEMRVAIVRPKSFDPSRRYAILDAAYAGPHANVAVSDASVFLHEQWLADTCDLVVVAIDAKGTPRRGRAWERAIDGKLGSVPLEGHVAALDALVKKYPELDESRVGVSGWSFGGYFSGFAALTKPELFKVAILGAPVVEWRDYDTAYTERYLGLPDAKAADYDAASLLTLASHSETHGSHLFLVHGTADDNVYFFHSLKLASALERAHVPFDFLPLPGVTHMLPADAELTEATWLRAAELLRRELGPSRSR